MVAVATEAQVYLLRGAQGDFETILESWINSRDSARTRQTYAESVRLAFRIMDRETPAQVTIADVASFKLSQQDKAPSTVALRLCALRGFFKFALANGYVKSDPTESIPIPKAHPPAPRALSIRSAKKIAEQIDTGSLVGLRDAVCVALLFAGLRVSEVAGLNVGDVNLEQQDGETFTRINVVGKGAKPRTVDLPHRIHELITRYLDARGGSHDPSMPLFVATASGYRKSPGRMSAKRLYRRFCYYAAKAKVRTTGSHTGRHTWTKLAEANGARMTDICNHLGHSSLAVTQAYLRRVSGTRNRASDVVPVVV